MWKAVLGGLVAAISGAAAMPAEAQQGGQPLTLERVFASPDLAGTTPRALKLSPDGKLADRCCATAPTRRSGSTCGRWIPPPANGGCWSIRKKVGIGRRTFRGREDAARARPASAARAASSPMTGRPTASRSSCRSTATSISPTLDGKVDEAARPAEAGEAQSRRSARAGGYVSYVRDQNLVVLELADRHGDAPATTRWRRHRPLGRGRVRRAGGNGPDHRLLVVARRQAHRGRALRRGAGRHRHPRGDRRRGDEDLRPALSQGRAPPTCWSNLW